MVARLFDSCGVLPSGIITSHITSTPFLRAGSGKWRTGLSMQSELPPSACLVDEPSKPQSGSCSRVGKLSNSLIWVLPRRFGTGVYPSSHMYSSLYFVIPVLSSVSMRDLAIPGETRTALPPLDGRGRRCMERARKCHSPPVAATSPLAISSRGISAFGPRGTRADSFHPTGRFRHPSRVATRAARRISSAPLGSARPD